MNPWRIRWMANEWGTNFDRIYLVSQVTNDSACAASIKRMLSAHNEWPANAQRMHSHYPTWHVSADQNMSNISRPDLQDRGLVVVSACLSRKWRSSLPRRTHPNLPSRLARMHRHPRPTLNCLPINHLLQAPLTLCRGTGINRPQILPHPQLPHPLTTPMPLSLLGHRVLHPRWSPVFQPGPSQKKNRAKPRGCHILQA